LDVWQACNELRRIARPDTAMFYTGAPAYPILPSSDEILDLILIKKGYCVYVVKDGESKTEALEKIIGQKGISDRLRFLEIASTQK